MITEHLYKYYHIPLYIFIGYIASKLLFFGFDKKKAKLRFKLTDYDEIFINELGNKEENKKEKKSTINIFFSKQKVELNPNRTYLIYDFDQVNNKSKVSTYVGETMEKSEEMIFEELSFFVSYVVSNFDPKTTEILLRISSPGGSAYKFEKGRDDILRLKKYGFKTIGFIDDICASGGYMLATACQKIICSETAKIGSIGVLTSYVNFYDILEKIGIKTKMIGTSNHKKITNFTGEKEDEEHHELIKEEIDYTLYMFLKIVSESRKDIDINLIKSAKVWYGEDALKNKLVDEINNIDDFIYELSKDNKIDNEIYFVSSTNKSEDTSIFNFMLKKVMG